MKVEFGLSTVACAILELGIMVISIYSFMFVGFIL